MSSLITSYRWTLCARKHQGDTFRVGGKIDVSRVPMHSSSGKVSCFSQYIWLTMLNVISEDKAWLETQVWHAKRMHMENLWGYRLVCVYWKCSAVDSFIYRRCAQRKRHFDPRIGHLFMVPSSMMLRITPSSR